MARFIATAAAGILAAFFLPAPGLAVEGFRGSTWGEIRYDLPREGENDLLLSGWARQGIDWKRWGDTRLSTFGILRYKWDSEKLDWNNSIGPGVGVGIDSTIRDQAVATFTVEYLWERFPESDRTDEKLLFYVNWYGWWDLRKQQR